MNLRWDKRGVVYVPDGKYEWSQSHAQVPVADIVDENILRIYYSTRDRNNKSHTSFIEVSASQPEKIISINDRPILPLGQLGTFDEDGIMPSSIVNVGDYKYLYYIGWSQRKNVPYQNSIGLAISEDGGRTFKKYSEGPVLGINHIDPFFTGTMFVLKENDFFRAYYLSCVGWKPVNGRPEPLYILKYASSEDGIDWKRNNRTAIGFKDENEGGLVSASVVMLNGKYIMLFGYRKYYDFRTNSANSYRIGFAESTDALIWARNDQKSGIDISDHGWDSEMISYPFMIEVKDQLYLFYNGNQFGKTGFGYAMLKPD